MSHPNDSIVCPAVYQDREKLLAFLGTIFLRSSDRQETNPAEMKWGTGVGVASLLKKPPLCGFGEALWGRLLWESAPAAFVGTLRDPSTYAADVVMDKFLLITFTCFFGDK